MNFTHGMAMQLQEVKTRILEKTFKIDETQDKYKSQVQKSSGSLQKNTSSSLKQMDSAAMLRKQTNMHKKKLTKNKMPGYQFSNLTGVDLKFCLSHPNLNANLEFETPEYLEDMSSFKPKSAKSDKRNAEIVKITGGKQPKIVERGPNFFEGCKRRYQ